MSDFTVDQRIELFKNFYNKSQRNYLVKLGRVYQYVKIKDMYSTDKISSGIEGTVYLANLKGQDTLTKDIVIKVTKLNALVNKKGISDGILNRNPLYIYDLFNKLKNHDKNFTLLIESIAYTLIDQLVVQRICPFFNVNYYWEYQQTEMNYYNEYIDGGGTFIKWYPNKSDQERLNILVQILIGVVTLQKHFMMVHGDLHVENVLIKKVAPGGYWTFKINNQLFRVPNLGWMAIINDFGFATIFKRVELDWYTKDFLRFFQGNSIKFYDYCYLVESLAGMFKKDNQQDMFRDVVDHSLIDFKLASGSGDSVYTVLEHNKHTKNPQKNKTIDYTHPWNMLDLVKFVHGTLVQQPKERELEVFDLDKPFNINLLPANFRQLVHPVNVPNFYL